MLTTLIQYEQNCFTSITFIAHVMGIELIEIQRVTSTVKDVKESCAIHCIGPNNCRNWKINCFLPRNKRNCSTIAMNAYAVTIVCRYQYLQFIECLRSGGTRLFFSRRHKRSS